MKTLILLVLMAALTACATTQTVSLFPRGPGQAGTGTFDQINQVLTVEFDGNVYRGTPITAVSSSQRGLFGNPTTTTTNQQTALLIGPAGQIRCEFLWASMRSIRQRHLRGPQQHRLRPADQELEAISLG